MGKTTVTNGDTVRDTITGFQGVVVGIVDYLTGCRQMLVVPPVDEKGELPKSHWFDEDRLENIGVERKRVDVVRAGPDAEAPHK